MKRYLDDSTQHEARELLLELLNDLSFQEDQAAALPSAWRAFAEEWATIDNIEGVFVYPAPLGGWQFDIRLKSVPTGCPLVLGSPSATPYRQRDEAVKAAARMLRSLSWQRTDRNAASRTETVLWFRLHDCDIVLPQLLFEFARSEQILHPMDAGDATAWLVARLESLDLAAAPSPAMTVNKVIETLSSEDRCGLLASLCRAHCAGIFQFPAARCLSPSGHTAHVTPQ